MIRNNTTSTGRGLLVNVLSSSRRPPVLTILLAFTLCLITRNVHAEIVTDRFVCALAVGSRSIELTYLDKVGNVPCEIRETRENGQSRTLWRANFDASFCQRQMDDHRALLDSLGWPCKTVAALESADDSATVQLSRMAALSLESNIPANTGIKSSAETIYSNTTETTTALYAAAAAGTTAIGVSSPLLAATTRVPGANTKARAITDQPPAKSLRESLHLTAEVTFVESSSESTTSKKALPPVVTPGVTAGQLSIEDARQIDDWLIYLSAQSMASIKHLMSDSESFNDYQLGEHLNSDNIYTRLQNRIEFLQTLLEKQ